MNWIERHQKLVLEKMRNPQLSMSEAKENELKAIRELFDAQDRIGELEKLVKGMGMVLTGLLPTLIPRHQVQVREILKAARATEV